MTQQSELARLRAEVAELRERLSFAESEPQHAEDIGPFTSLSTETLLQSALANLPTTGLRNGALAWVSDGRKTGEGASAGTGVLAYFDEASGNWLRFGDDSAAAT